jgi:hypothetical protein
MEIMVKQYPKPLMRKKIIIAIILMVVIASLGISYIAVQKA